MIVVVQTAFLGDLILSIPALRRIRQNYPDQKIGVVCKKGLGSFLQKFHICEQVFEVEKNNQTSYRAILETINQQNVFAVFCFHRSVRSLILTFQIKASEKFGFASFLGRFVFDKTIDYKKKWPDVIRYMALLKLVDQDVEDYFDQSQAIDFEALNFYGQNHRFELIPELFQFEKLNFNRTVQPRKILIFPGSVWATKKWTQRGFTDLVQIFKQAQLQVFLMGSPQEKKLCEEIVQEAGYGIVKAGDFSIEQSIDFMSDAQFVVCNDSASAHMAAFVQRPAFVIFGPTTLNLGFRPWNDESRVIEKKLDCRPCGAHGHHQCPLKHHHCMENISAQDVWSMISQSGLLNNF